MNIEIRLQKILAERSLDKHGITQRIARDIGVHRHTISKLYHNRLENPSLDILGRLCKWLHEVAGVPQDRLPQALFGARPSFLWEAIAGKGNVSLFVGEYFQTEKPAAAWRWISRRDAEVAARFVRELSAQKKESGVNPPEVDMKYVSFRWDRKMDDITKKPSQDDLKKTRKIFKQMRAASSSNTPILIGSQRVNYLVEYFVAEMFGCPPFSETNRQFRVPFYLCYRHGDRMVQSCFGGLQNPSDSRQKPVAGIYYLDEDGKWNNCPWKSYEQDAGVVITSYVPGTKALEIAVFGFSGRATEAMGEIFISNADRFWPPPVYVKGKQIGVYICKFDFIKSKSAEEEDLQVKNLDIISLQKKILKEYTA